MKAMYDRQVAPFLEKESGGMKIRRRTLKVAGMSESAVDQKVGPVYKQYTNPQTTILATTSGVELHLTAGAQTDEEADRLLLELADRIEDTLGSAVFSNRGELLEEVIGRLLLMKRYTVAVAESCTGGMITKRLTDIAGSSRYFLGGVIAYSDQVKAGALGVPKELIEAHGSVSQEVAEAMAAQVKQQLGATLGLSVTGIAGPTGGTTEKPVGLIFIGFADDVHVEHLKIMLGGDRERIRELAAQVALTLLYQRLL
jgi:nicotinamide-nucleotide amidase